MMYCKGVREVRFKWSPACPTKAWKQTQSRWQWQGLLQDKTGKCIRVSFERNENKVIEPTFSPYQTSVGSLLLAFTSEDWMIFVGPVWKDHLVIQCKTDIHLTHHSHIVSLACVVRICWIFYMLFCLQTSPSALQSPRFGSCASTCMSWRHGQLGFHSEEVSNNTFTYFYLYKIKNTMSNLYSWNAFSQF